MDLRASPNWNSGMMEPWNDGFWENGVMASFFVNHFGKEFKIGKHPLKPIFHHSNVPLFHLQII